MNEVLDARWIEDYKALALSPYLDQIDSKLRADDLDAKFASFMESDGTVNPDLQPIINLEEVDQHHVSLVELRDQIVDKEDEPVVIDAYVPRITELLNNLTLLRSAATGDVDSYIAANVEIFGEPNRDVFYSAIGFMGSIATEAVVDSRPAIRERAKKVIDLLPNNNHSVDNQVSNEDFLIVKNLYNDLFSEVAYHLKELPQIIKGDVVLNTAQSVIESLGFDYKAVPQKRGLSTMAVWHGTKEVKLPLDEEYTVERLLGLLVHEVYTHVNERINGEKQPLRILFNGLNRYIRAGEGKGLTAEQVVYGSPYDFMKTKRAADVMRRHLAIDFARGLDDDTHKDFKKVFESMNTIDNMLEIIANPNDPELSSNKAAKRTWELLAKRTQKGVVGEGAAAFKDEIYAEGSPEQMALLAANPQVFPYLNLGKYDLTNPNHVSILERTGILPDNIMGTQNEKR